MKKAFYFIVVGIGLIQITGYIFKLPSLRGLGAATASSPLPIVFTEVKGVETFANDFFLQYETERGEKQEIKITPETYSKIKGPYNRRNVYGAAISYGPILPQKLRDTIFYYAFCKKKLLRELMLSDNIQNLSIRIKSKTVNKNKEWIFNAHCAK